MNNRKGPNMKKLLILALAIAIASLGLVACGGSDDSTSAETQPPAAAETGSEDETGAEAEGGTADSASVVDFETPPGAELAYTADSAEAEAGEVTINFTNVQSTPHDVKIEDDGGETIGGTDVISEDSASAEVELEPGTYTFYCSIPGHRQAGMEGTLTVK
jgi:plastocyanin